jgi:hypothetical protein
MNGRRKRKGGGGKPTNALYNAVYYAWFIGELMQALEGKWKPLSDEEAAALQKLIDSRPKDLEDRGDEILAWDGVTKIKPPKLVTSEQFFSDASKEDWAMAQFLLDERQRLERSDRSIFAP